MEKIAKFIKDNLRYIVIFVFLFCFVLILTNVFETEMMKMDSFAYTYIVGGLRNDTLTSIMKVITNLGGATFIIITAILCIIFVKNKKEKLYIALNLISCSSLNYILKQIIQRPRPDASYMLVEQTGFSFPSGHTMTSAAFYGFFIYLICKNIKDKKLKIICSLSLSILIILIGFSRVYLGVHYMSDVIGALLLSIIYLLVYTRVIS